MTEVLVAGFAGWRLASLLVLELGPWDIFELMRVRLGLPATGQAGEIPRGIGSVLSCVWCTSVWTSCLAYAIAHWIAIEPVAVLAAAGVAVAVHAHIDR